MHHFLRWFSSSECLHPLEKEPLRSVDSSLVGGRDGPGTMISNVQKPCWLLIEREFKHVF